MKDTAYATPPTTRFDQSVSKERTAQDWEHGLLQHSLPDPPTTAQCIDDPVVRGRGHTVCVRVVVMSPATAATLPRRMTLFRVCPFWGLSLPFSSQRTLESRPSVFWGQYNLFLLTSSHHLCQAKLRDFGFAPLRVYATADTRQAPAMHWDIGDAQHRPCGSRNYVKCYSYVHVGCRAVGCAVGTFLFNDLLCALLLLSKCIDTHGDM